LIVAAVALLSGCASVPAHGQVVSKVESALFLSDFTAAQSNYANAAAAQPAGSALAAQFTASAACMTSMVNKFTPASSTIVESNKGLISLASIIDIQISIAKAQAGVATDVNCDTLVGHIINGLNASVIKAATGGLL
jgi:hypothetical protein